jgi:hypothetical protein
MNKSYTLVFVLLLSCSFLHSCSDNEKPYSHIQVSLDAENYTDNFDKVTYYQKPRPKVTIIPPSWLILNVFNKSGMPEPISVKIGKDLPEFTFAFHGKWTRKPKTKYEFFYLSHVEVIDSSTSKAVQTIEHKDEFEGLMCFPDLNQDGYLDLMVMIYQGATGIYGCEVHIFQPELKRFKRHSLLSKMDSVSLNEDSNLIATYYRSGHCEEFREYFSMEKDGALMLEKVEWTERDNAIESSTGCSKFTAVPRGSRNITYLGRRFFPYDERFTRLLHQKVKVVKKEESFVKLNKRYKIE